ncbi:hypothetical protein [Ferrovibrio sp.]|uniref:hypothetical protein n=1 Tax=Ferrovibrio sp. TaxID=1917215 RepID=UPI0025BDBEA6|nr:hypothetical protein [Ferrovibrio sp.]MBX3455867.1 hypothetical protein [Ferrovibrio sp.]
MINFQLASFLNGLSLLDVAKSRARFAEPQQFVDTSQAAIIRSNISAIASHCAQLNMPTALHRLSRIEVMLGSTTTNESLHHELSELFTAVEHDAYQEFFCHYQKDKLSHIKSMEAEWKIVFKSFKSTKSDAEAGVDCFALGHNTACVFHMMRVAEAGLRALARERSVKLPKQRPLEYGNWEEIIRETEREAEKIKNKPVSKNRDAAETFYTGCVSDLRHLKANYRNKTMHLRDSYDAGQAMSSIFRTKSFMLMVASKINEDHPRKINWRL